MDFEKIDQDNKELKMSKEILKTPAGESVEALKFTPASKKSEVAVVIAPGWSATARVQAENARVLADAYGRETWVLDSPHGVKTSADWETPEAEARKAEALSAVTANLEKVDAVAHSEGALYTTAAALKNPAKFRSLTFIAPAGLSSEDNFWGLSKRFVADLVKQNQLKNKEIGRSQRIGIATREGAKSIFKSLPKSLAEVRAIAETQIGDNLIKLRQAGVKTIIIHSVGDKAFPMEKMQAYVKKEMIDGFVSVGDTAETGEMADTHNAWYLTPEKYARAVGSLLETIEKNEKIRSS